MGCNGECGCGGTCGGRSSCGCSGPRTVTASDSANRFLASSTAVTGVRGELKLHGPIHGGRMPIPEPVVADNNEAVELMFGAGATPVTMAGAESELLPVPPAVVSYNGAAELMSRVRAAPAKPWTEKRFPMPAAAVSNAEIGRWAGPWGIVGARHVGIPAELRMNTTERGGRMALPEPVVADRGLERFEGDLFGLVRSRERLPRPDWQDVTFDQVQLGDSPDDWNDVAIARCVEWCSQFALLKPRDECVCCCWAIRDRNRGTDWLDELPDCPCTIQVPPQGDVSANGATFESGPASQVYHPGGMWELRQKMDGVKPGQQCIYGADGRLVNRGPAAGTPDRSGPGGGFQSIFEHWKKDVLSYTRCLLAGMLDCYLALRLPNDGGEGCPANPPDVPAPDYYSGCKKCSFYEWQISGPV